MGLKRAAGLLAAAMLAGAAPAGAAQGNGLIAYQRGGVFTIDPVSGASSLLHDGFSPAFSLDGTRIAFETSTPGGPFNIVVTGADGSNPVQIGTTLAPRPLVWSPDGTRIAFVAGDSSSGFSIIVSKADGGGSSTVSIDASADAPPSWSPDGTALAFTTTTDTDVAIAKADGSGRRLLIQDATRDMAPSWSPDGSQIAFVRGTSGNLLLYTIRPDGSGLHQLGQIQADSLSPPAWSPDGSRLVFGAREQVGWTPRTGPYYRNNV